MQAPPTPPPTSATELRDEARDATVLSSEPPTSASQGSVGPDPYEQAFPQICDLAMKRDFSAVVQYAELRDLNGINHSNYTRLLLVTPLILAYLVLDDLPPAQHVLARLPSNLLHHPLSQALARLLASTMDRKYSSIYPRVQILCNLVQQPESRNPMLAKVVTSTAAAFVESFRRRTFVLLSKAFASLTLSQARAYLGLTREQLLSASDWQHDSTTDILYPSRTISSADRVSPAAPSSFGTFRLVTDGLVKLGV